MKKTGSTLSSILFVLSLAPIFAQGSAMSEPKAKCMTLESITDSHIKWSKSFEDYLTSYGSLSEQEKFEISQGAMTNIVTHLKKLNRSAQLSSNSAMINDAENLLQEIKEGNRPASAANGILKSGLIRLNDAMNDSIQIAQNKFPDCDLVKASKSPTSKSVSQHSGTR